MLGTCAYLDRYFCGTLCLPENYVHISILAAFVNSLISRGEAGLCFARRLSKYTLLLLIYLPWLKNEYYLHRPHHTVHLVVVGNSWNKEQNKIS